MFLALKIQFISVYCNSKHTHAINYWSMCCFEINWCDLKPYITSNIKDYPEVNPGNENSEFTAIIDSIKDLSLEIIKRNPNIPSEASFAIKNIESRSFLINFVSSKGLIAALIFNLLRTIPASLSKRVMSSPSKAATVWITGQQRLTLSPLWTKPSSPRNWSHCSIKAERTNGKKAAIHWKLAFPS